MPSRKRVQKTKLKAKPAQRKLPIRIRNWLVASTTPGRSEIIAIPVRPTTVPGLEKAFGEKDSVLEITVNATRSRDMIDLIRRLREESSFLKSKGYVGFYGYTPNSALIRLLGRNFQIRTQRAPEPKEQEIQKQWAESMEKGGYSRAYFKQPVFLVFARFE